MLRFEFVLGHGAGWVLYLSGERVEWCATLADGIAAYYAAMEA